MNIYSNLKDEEKKPTNIFSLRSPPSLSPLPPLQIGTIRERARYNPCPTLEKPSSIIWPGLCINQLHFPQNLPNHRRKMVFKACFLIACSVSVREIESQSPTQHPVSPFHYQFRWGILWTSPLSTLPTQTTDSTSYQHRLSVSIIRLTECVACV